MWNKYQAILILKSLYVRINSASEKKPKITHEGHSTTYSSYEESGKIYISFERTNPRRVYLSLDDSFSGSVTFSRLPWKDQEAKSLIKFFLNYKLDEQVKSAGENIYKVFPEALSIDFEKQVLNGKK